MKTKLVTLTFQVPSEQRRALKILAARLNLPVRALLERQIDRLLVCEESPIIPSQPPNDHSNPQRN